MSAGPEKDDPTYEISCCVDPVRVRARDGDGDVAAGVCPARWQPDPGLRRQQPDAKRRQRCVLQPRYGEGHRRPGWLQGLGLRLRPERPGRHRLHGQQEQLPSVRARIRARPAEQVQRRDPPHLRRRVLVDQSLHARHPRLQSERGQDRRTPSRRRTVEAYNRTVRRSGSRSRTASRGGASSSPTPTRRPTPGAARTTALAS